MKDLAHTWNAVGRLPNLPIAETCRRRSGGVVGGLAGDEQVQVGGVGPTAAAFSQPGVDQADGQFVEVDGVSVPAPGHSDDQTCEVEGIEAEAGDLERAQAMDGHERPEAERGACRDRRGVPQLPPAIPAPPAGNARSPTTA